MRTALFCIGLLIAAGCEPALAGDAPASADPYARPAAAAPRAPARLTGPIAANPDRRPLDPVACASLCRLFEFMGSLERRKPVESVPTS